MASGFITVSEREREGAPDEAKVFFFFWLCCVFVVVLVAWELLWLWITGLVSPQHVGS